MESSKSTVQAILDELEEWLSLRAEMLPPHSLNGLTEEGFFSFLRSTLQSHMTSGGIRAGDRGPAGRDPVASESGGSHE